MKGEKVAVMGINGGGKSTLFKTLALGISRPIITYLFTLSYTHFPLGENIPTHGQVFIDGCDLIRNNHAIGASGMFILIDMHSFHYSY